MTAIGIGYRNGVGIGAEPGRVLYPIEGVDVPVVVIAGLSAADEEAQAAVGVPVAKDGAGDY